MKESQESTGRCRYCKKEYIMNPDEPQERCVRCGQWFDDDLVNPDYIINEEINEYKRGFK